VTLHYRLDGPHGAPPLVLCNSLGTTLEMWDAQVADLSAQFRLTRYDQRGHGRSPVPPGPYSIEDLGRDALGLLDDLGIERTSFCGLSIGGMVGMWLASEAPERIDRLVLCSTAPTLPPREQWLERAATVRADGVSAIADAAVDRWFTPLAPDSLRETFRTMLVETPAEGYAGCCEALAQFDMRGQLDAITAPTLVIAGEDDPVGTPERAGAVGEEIEGSHVVILPEARHLAAVEQADAVTRELEQHLGVGAAK
jgi:3-oxoadipate enol-lactonase